MSTAQLLALLLAISIAANVAVATALLARQAGAPAGQAIITGLGTAATGLGIYLAAVAAYR